MNLRFIFLLCLGFLFIGCGHLIQSKSLPQKGIVETAESSTMAQNKPNQNANFSNQYNAETDAIGVNDSIGEENNLEPIGSNATIAIQNDENPADKTTLFIKKSQTLLDEALDLCQMSQDLWQNGELENALQALD